MWFHSSSLFCNWIHFPSISTCISSTRRWLTIHLSSVWHTASDKSTAAQTENAENRHGHGHIWWMSEYTSMHCVQTYTHNTAYALGAKYHTNQAWMLIDIYISRRNIFLTPLCCWFFRLSHFHLLYVRVRQRNAVHYFFLISFFFVSL